MPVVGSQSRSEFRAASKPSSVRPCPSAQRHVDRDERPRDGALHSPILFGGSPGGSARAAELNERGARRASRAARCHEGITRQSRLVCAAVVRMVRVAAVCVGNAVISRTRTRQGPEVQTGLSQASGFERDPRAGRRPREQRRAGAERGPLAATRAPPQREPHAAIGTKTSSSRKALKTGPRGRSRARARAPAVISVVAALRVSRRRETSSRSGEAADEEERGVPLAVGEGSRRSRGRDRRARPVVARMNANEVSARARSRSRATRGDLGTGVVNRRSAGSAAATRSRRASRRRDRMRSAHQPRRGSGSTCCRA